MRCHGTGRPSAATLSFASWTRFLAESLDSGRDGQPDPLDLDRLGHRDEEHVVRPSTGALAGASDALMHSLEVCANVLVSMSVRLADSSTPRAGLAFRRATRICRSDVGSAAIETSRPILPRRYE